MEGVKEEGDVELYAKLDSAYSSDEEDVEDEDDEAYLRSFDNSVAVQNGDDRTSLDGSDANSDDEGDYSDEDDDEDDDNDEEDGFDYENDDEDDVPPTTSDGDLYNHTDFGSSDSENYVSLSGRGDPDVKSKGSALDSRNSYSEQSTELTNTCS